MHQKLFIFMAAISLLCQLTACREAGQDSPVPSDSPALPANGAKPLSTIDGISVPAGFGINLFAEGLGPARHMVSRANGDVFVRLSGAVQGKCLVALRDSDGDGRAEQTQYFGDSDCGTGLAIDAQHLYYANDEEIWRMPLGPELLPNSPPERIAFALGKPAQHNARSLALDGAGHVYVNIGAPSNACQQQDRTPGSPGQDPCPLLSEFAGIWRFDINQRDQRKTPALRYASGIRNAVALDWHRDRLYLLQHGRDQLDTMFPDRFTAAQNTELPAEEFVALRQGEDLGWPYCYFDPAKSRKVLMPEYGGNGESVGRCGNFVTPLIGFPAHYAPNDLIFYSGNQFPAEYRDGAFIAFHGSWNRGGQQAGYHVVFVPFSGDKAGQWRVFANGFAGTEPIRSSGQARYRPMGLAQLPDGSLLVVDSKTGRIWKISHQGR